MKLEFIDLKKQYRLLESEIQERMTKVLLHGQYILGPEVKELEEKLATYAGVKHCIGCSSGTDALLIALMALRLVRVTPALRRIVWPVLVTVPRAASAGGFGVRPVATSRTPRSSGCWLGKEKPRSDACWSWKRPARSSSPLSPRAVRSGTGTLMSKFWPG